MQERAGACTSATTVPIQTPLGKRQLKLAPRPRSASSVTLASDSASSAMDNKESKDSAAAQAGAPPNYLAQLLPGATEWPHSDESLAEALRLRQEQERTKQEYYRLESRKRTLEILAAAGRAGIAAAAIPALFDYQTGANASRPQGQAQGQGPHPSGHPQPPAHPVIPQAMAMGMGAPGAAAAAAAGAAASVGASDGPELVNYEDAQQRSPSRFRATHVRSSSALPATQFGGRPVTQAYFQRPQLPAQTPPAAGSSNLQFHHWKPSPSRQDDKRKQLERSPKQIKAEHASPTPAPAGVQVQGAPSSASTSAAARRRSHMRHRSEAAIPSTQRPPYWNRTDEGVSILAGMASDRSKHDVGYILTADRSPARAPPPVQPQSSPGVPQAQLQGQGTSQGQPQGQPHGQGQHTPQPSSHIGTPMPPHTGTPLGAPLGAPAPRSTQIPLGAPGPIAPAQGGHSGPVEQHGASP